MRMTSNIDIYAILLPGPTMVCNMDFNSTEFEQVITSPNYPSNYPHSLTNCGWTIKGSQDGRSSVIYFQDFRIEQSWDQVRLYLDGNLHGTFSGSSMTDEPFSFTQEARVTLTTDSNIHYRGFRATFHVGW